MVFKAFFRISVESLLFNTANETKIFCVVKDSYVYISQLCKSINDNTKDDIQENCDDKQEEGQIVNGPKVESLRIFRSSRLGR